MTSRPPQRPSPLSPLLREAHLLRHAGVWSLVAQATVIGGVSGLVMGAFRHLYDLLSPLLVNTLKAHDIHTWPWALGLAGALGAMGLLAGWLLRLEPLISGSGIPQVELTLRGRAPWRRGQWRRILACKFVGTLNSLVAGLSVGREGPCVQMGAAVGAGVAELTGGPALPRHYIGGCVAGLAAAFGAPVAATFFAFEELKSIISAPLVLFTLVAALTAFGVTNGVLGLGLVFPLSAIPALEWQQLWLCPLVAVAAGLLGMAYNACLVAALYALDRQAWLPAWARTLSPFAASLALIYLYPAVIVGLGPGTADLALGDWTGLALLALFAVKLAYSVGSFASGVAGGILMPVLGMGAMLGAAVASLLAENALLAPQLQPTLTALGMVAFFAGSVRAPLTAAALVTEMCGCWQCLPEIALTALVATFMANRLGSVPVYDRLRKRLWRHMRPAHPTPSPLHRHAA